MTGGVLSPLLAFVAGVLTILSPCVLPLVPIVLAGAAQKGRWAPLALSAGLVLSFTATGLFIATLGSAIGLDAEALRWIGALMLIAVGAALLLSDVEALTQRLAAPLANWAAARQASFERFGLAGQAMIGMLLGLVWSPCVGPTLGAATVLAAQGQDLGHVAIVMAAFGTGIASVLLVVASVARTVFAQWRGRLMQAGSGGKKALGSLVLAVGVMIVTGVDRIVETAFLDHAPIWLTTLTTTV